MESILIQIKNTEHIVGIWMCEKIYLGRVYVVSVKDDEPDQWVEYIKYNYDNKNINLYMSDNDYKNIIIHKNINEMDLIKICNNKIDDLSILFSNCENKVLVGGDLLKYNEIMGKNIWMPPLSILPKDKKKKRKD